MSGANPLNMSPFYDRPTGPPDLRMIISNVWGVLGLCQCFVCDWLWAPKCHQALGWSLELLFVYVCVCVYLCLCCICSLYIFIYILCMLVTDYLRPNVAWPRDVVQSPPLNATHRHRSASHPINALCTITQCSITKWCTPISNAYNAHCTFVLVPFLVFHSNWQPVPPHKFTVHYYTAMARRTIPLCKVYQCNEHNPSLSSSCSS